MPPSPMLQFLPALIQTLPSFFQSLPALPQLIPILLQPSLDLLILSSNQCPGPGFCPGHRSCHSPGSFPGSCPGPDSCPSSRRTTCPSSCSNSHHSSCTNFCLQLAPAPVPAPTGASALAPAPASAVGPNPNPAPDSALAPTPAPVLVPVAASAPAQPRLLFRLLLSTRPLSRLLPLSWLLNRPRLLPAPAFVPVPAPISVPAPALIRFRRFCDFTIAEVASTKENASGEWRQYPQCVSLWRHTLPAARLAAARLLWKPIALVALLAGAEQSSEEKITVSDFLHHSWRSKYEI